LGLAGLHQPACAAALGQLTQITRLELVHFATGRSEYVRCTFSALKVWEAHFLVVLLSPEQKVKDPLRKMFRNIAKLTRLEHLVVRSRSIWPIKRKNVQAVGNNLYRLQHLQLTPVESVEDTNPIALASLTRLRSLAWGYEDHTPQGCLAGINFMTTLTFVLCDKR
jgi:hypothetical protein